MTPEQRSEIARNAVRARWARMGKLKEINEIDGDSQNEPADSGDLGPADAILAEKPYSMFPGTIILGGLEFECHVLSDFRRVFTQTEMVRAISGGRESGNLARYLSKRKALLSLGGKGAP